MKASNVAVPVGVRNVSGHSGGAARAGRVAVPIGVRNVSINDRAHLYD